MRTGTREMTPASIPLSFRDLIKRRVQRRIGFAGEQLRLSFQAENRSRQLHRKPPFRAVSATPPYAFARTECVRVSTLPRLSNASPIGVGRHGPCLPGDTNIPKSARQPSARTHENPPRQV